MSHPPPLAEGQSVRHFVTYSGIRPPVRMVEPIDEAAMDHRNTFVRAVFDAADRLVRFDKMVYGASELTHVYVWGADGRLASAEITAGEETVRLDFAAAD